MMLDRVAWSLLTAVVSLLVTQAALAASPTPLEIQTQVCVVGGGSGGFGAALAAARAGADVILVEQHAQLGGTSTMAYVSSWEPGPGESFARELYERLKKVNAAGVTSDSNGARKQGAFGHWQVTPYLDYDDSTRRTGKPYSKGHGVVFEPGAMSRAMAQMLAETNGKCRVMLRTRFTGLAVVEGARVVSIEVTGPDGAAVRIGAKVFIDCTGEVVLCRAAGCETMLGAEPQSRFNEPYAPKEALQQLNGISWCYRIRKSEKPAAALPPDVPVKAVPRSAHVTEVPGTNDAIVNPLALIPGERLIELGYEKTVEACRPVVQAHWAALQKNPVFAGYELVDLAPMLGIRESYRVVGQYVLTQHDVMAGLSGQEHADMIAIADHSLDVHGSGRKGMARELAGPYGIPYRCLIPKGKENLLVACRGASFSAIAASSCRLSRTMMALGHAAGLAAAQAVERGIGVERVDVKAIQEKVGMAGKK